MVVTARPAIWAMVRKVGRPLADAPSGARRLLRREGRDFVVTKLSPPSATERLLMRLALRCRFSTPGSQQIQQQNPQSISRREHRTASAGVFADVAHAGTVFSRTTRAWKPRAGIIAAIVLLVGARCRRIENRQSVWNRLVLEHGSRPRLTIFLAATGLYVQLALGPPEGRRTCISLLAMRSKPGLPANG